VNFLGWVYWLYGDLAQAQSLTEQALAMAERIGETLLLGHSLLGLALIALRRHDTEQMRALLPRTMAAAVAIGPREFVAGTKACEAWLAWQDGKTDDVMRLSREYEQLGSTSVNSCARYRWVYLFPLVAAQLSTGATAAAVAAGRQILDPSQQLLPDELTAVLQAACDDWDRGEEDNAADGLCAALDLARQLRYI
jgi:hypothetical protein